MKGSSNYSMCNDGGFLYESHNDITTEKEDRCTYDIRTCTVHIYIYIYNVDDTTIK